MIHYISKLCVTMVVFALMVGCGEKSSSETENEATAKSYRWKMATAWAPNFPILGEGAKLFAEQVERLSDGQLQIQVYGANELIPPFEVFDNVSRGTIEAGHGTPYYWGGKIPGAIPFSTIPFGILGGHHATWLYQGGGNELWRSLYGKYNVIPFFSGSSLTQMGGWFNKEIKSVSDLKGLKMRIPGWGGKVLSELGGSPVTVPAGEIYTSLERGVIDAVEWIGPSNDISMGFDKIAKYYYYPGWHEPGTAFEVIVNKEAFEQLPSHLQAAVESASAYTAIWMTTRFEMQNAKFLKKLADKNVILKKFPDEVIKALKVASEDVVRKEIEKDENLKKVYESLMDFKSTITPWYNISEGTIAPHLYKADE